MRNQLAIVYRNPKRRSMLKCAEASATLNARSRSNSPVGSTRPQRPSALSPTLCALLPLLQRLEESNPLRLAAVHRFVAQEVAAPDETPRPLELPFEAPPSPAWGWRGHGA